MIIIVRFYSVLAAEGFGRILRLVGVFVHQAVEGRLASVIIRVRSDSIIRPSMGGLSHDVSPAVCWSRDKLISVRYLVL